MRFFAGNVNSMPGASPEGQLLSIAQNTALFSLLGTTYGGNGVTTFALPDLRGRTILGSGQGPGLTNSVLGASVGSATQTLSEAQMPGHVHSLPRPATKPDRPEAISHSITCSRRCRDIPGGDGGDLSRWRSSKRCDALYCGVKPFAGNFAPSGWHVADGSLLSIAQNTALFSLIGTTYGGNSQTTFALPDLRGRTAIGSGQGPGLSNRLPGEEPGVEN